MLDTRSKKLLGTLILATIIVVTLVMAPYSLIEPINLPKLLTLSFFSTVLISLIVPSIKQFFRSDLKFLIAVTLLFVLQILLVLVFSGANFASQFYGTFGRNTGALAYISLSVLLMSSAVVADTNFLKRFIRVALFVGAVLIIYGNIQYLGLEPFPFVNLYTINAPIGTFGNPDFQSAFMGIIAVLSFTMALNSAFKILTRLLLIVMGIASVVVIYETLAKQGYFAFLAGAVTVAVLWLFMTGQKKAGLIFSGFGAVSGVIVLLGLINLGPLADYLYKASLTARGFYWQAAMKMFVDHPFFGVGMDGFVDWFRRARPSNYYEKGFFSYSNAAHNVYLDIASSGGFPLILFYCAIVVLVVISVVKVAKRQRGFDVYFAALVGAWVAYQAQSFISINQLGLAIWGWVLSGLIIGYEINSKDGKIDNSPPVKGKNQQRKAKPATQPLSSAVLMRAFGGVVLGAIVAIPPYYVNASFFSALKSGDIKRVQTAAYLKPIDERRLLHVATILRDNKMDDESILVLRDATKKYPDSFDLWQLWTTIPRATLSDTVLAKIQMKRLDPFNPDIK